MKERGKLFVLFLAIQVISACSNNEPVYDASGAFEAEEIIVSSEASGVIRTLDLEEGKDLKAGQQVGYVDSLQLYLRKKQVQAQINALLSKKPNVAVQLAAMQTQLKTAEKEKNRISKLLEADAATGKQLDDIQAQIEVINKQIAAQQSSLELTVAGISKDAMPLYVQVEQLEDQLAKCKIVNPIDGTVLVKYAEQNETTAAGKALYKIADLRFILLRAYITGNQLPQVRLNQDVKVYTDDGLGGFKETIGTISWISDKAEFTPKTIQTKDERANQVYAIKIKVKNEGAYKIGMYGEVKFQ